MSLKARRRQLILDILTQNPTIANQERLAALLTQRGMASTQATLSRDLRDLNVLKGPSGYVLSGSGDQGVKNPAVEKAVRDFLLSCQPAASIVVLRTRPGHAPALALEIDRAGFPGVAGSIAGDDTIFLAANSPARAKTLARGFRETIRES